MHISFKNAIFISIEKIKDVTKSVFFIGFDICKLLYI
jgi:hypothetical protein